MSVITEYQKEFIKLFSKTPLRDSFFLTGGTALSEFYLHHRLSEDLDFFTEEPNQVPFVLPHIEEITQKMKGSLRVAKQFKTYLEIFVHLDKEEVIKCDFAQDAPFRLKDKVYQKKYEIFSDNQLDIACNKLSALFDRTESKDFIDIYFLDKEYIKFDKLLDEAKKKHIGLDDYWLAISLKKVEDITIFPRMIKPLNQKEMKDFFKIKARELIKKDHSR